MTVTPASDGPSSCDPRGSSCSFWRVNWPASGNCSTARPGARPLPRARAVRGGRVRELFEANLAGDGPPLCGRTRPPDPSNVALTHEAGDALPPHRMAPGPATFTCRAPCRCPLGCDANARYMRAAGAPAPASTGLPPAYGSTDRRRRPRPRLSANARAMDRDCAARHHRARARRLRCAQVAPSPPRPTTSAPTPRP